MGLGIGVDDIANREWRYFLNMFKHFCSHGLGIASIHHRHRFLANNEAQVHAVALVVRTGPAQGADPGLAMVSEFLRGE